MTSIVRRGGLAVFAAVAVLAAAGCSVTSHSAHCSDGICTVTLNGSGASSELWSGATTVTLVSVEAGTATIDVSGTQGSCSAEETIDVAGMTVECTDVGERSVDLTVTA